MIIIAKGFFKLTQSHLQKTRVFFQDAWLNTNSDDLSSIDLADAKSVRFVSHMSPRTRVRRWNFNGAKNNFNSGKKLTFFKQIKGYLKHVHRSNKIHRYVHNFKRFLVVSLSIPKSHYDWPFHFVKVELF